MYKKISGTIINGTSNHQSGNGMHTVNHIEPNIFTMIKYVTPSGLWAEALYVYVTATTLSSLRNSERHYVLAIAGVLFAIAGAGK